MADAIAGRPNWTQMALRDGGCMPFNYPTSVQRRGPRVARERG